MLTTLIHTKGEATSLFIKMLQLNKELLQKLLSKILELLVPKRYQKST